MDIQGDMQITLVIKAPNQRMEDQTVDCMMGWTIRKLKHHLERVYPSKPKHHEQRLIYSGKLLQDHLTLKEILKQYDTDSPSLTHTVHLVCSNTSSPNSSTPSSTSQRAKEQTSPQSSSSSFPPSTSNTGADLPSPAPSDVSSSQNDGIRYRGTSQSQNPPVSSSFQSFPYQQPFPPMANTVPPAGYPYTPEQYAWMVQQQQQAYSQYMMQYMQYYQSMYGMAPPINPLNMPAPNITPLTPPQQPVVHPQPQQQQQPAAGGGNNNEARGNNVRMNAQGGMEEDDEDERDPRDWLHHTYFIMRFITFVGIIVFYSSFSRFVMVMAGFLVIYFFQKMRVAREQQVRRQQQQRQEQQQREEEERQQQEQQQQQQQQGQLDQTEPSVPEPQAQDTQQENQENVPTENSNASPEESNATNAEQPAEVAQEEGNKIMRSIYFILKTVETFFTSLVPAPPELMEAN